MWRSCAAYKLMPQHLALIWGHFFERSPSCLGPSAARFSSPPWLGLSSSPAFSLHKQHGGDAMQPVGGCRRCRPAVVYSATALGWLMELERARAPHPRISRASIKCKGRRAPGPAPNFGTFLCDTRVGRPIHVVSNSSGARADLRSLSVPHSTLASSRRAGSVPRLGPLQLTRKMHFARAHPELERRRSWAAWSPKRRRARA